MSTTGNGNGAAVEPVPTLRLHIDPQRITVGTILDLEELRDQKQPSAKALVNLLRDFVVGADGEPADDEAALGLLRKLTYPQLLETVEALGQTMGAAAITPPTASA